MNKTKKLTQGAMLLAILGALILIDRMIAYSFTEFVVLAVPVIIIMYSAMQSFKDGLVLSVGVLIIAFLLGNFQMLYVIYTPVGVLTGLVYAYAMNKGLDQTTLLFLACATYIVGEVIAAYVIYPLYGFPVAQLIEEYKTSLNGISSMGGMNYNDVFSSVGLDFNKLIVILFFIGTILTGAMEGFLIHLLAIFLLKRFKIKDIGKLSLWDIKPNKVVAYIAFLSTFSFFLKSYIPNENIFYALFALGIVGCVVLLYYGYLFICLYCAMVLRKNYAPFVILIGLFVPVIFILLIIAGFLYAAGPLRDFLEKKVKQIKHE